MANLEGSSRNPPGKGARSSRQESRGGTANGRAKGGNGHAAGADGSAKPGGRANFITGIASSAGGLESLGPLVANLSAAAPMSYVVVQHLSPQHRSMMAELLARETALRVEEITDGAQPQSGVIYITPPNHDVILSAGALRLVAPSVAGPKPSADRFFESLAENCGERAIGVVLSGTGSDGAAGLQAVKRLGGVAVAQDPKTARYDGMPRSALAIGGLDATLAPAEIGRRLTQYATAAARDDVFPPVADVDEALPLVLSHIERATGVDFAGYKESTLLRRLSRRLQATGAADVRSYLQVLQRDAEEPKRFVQEALISVTSFFRDREIFDQMPAVLDDILGRKRDGQSVRAWVTGCATGEEAYSMAMLLLDGVRRRERRLHIQVFATDIDEKALAQARHGSYSEAAVELVPQELRDHYFQRQGAGFAVTKELRDCVILARHDLTRDTPFVRMDLVSCRNVLIYLNQELQQEVFNALHFALNNNGLLILGRSEAPGMAAGLFAPMAGEGKLFRRLQPARQHSRPISLRRREALRPATGRSAEITVRQALLEHLKPRAFLIDARGEVRETEGNLDGIITLPPGKTQLNISRLVVPDLRPDLATLLARTRRDNVAAIGTPRQTPIGRVRLTTKPAGEDEAGQPLYLVVIEDVQDQAQTEPAAQSGERLPELEQELAATKEHLQSVIEELEASNEELQALNEELQASNEELQATSEEMETSNEELQATNEELTTLNEELRSRTADLQALNDTLENIQTSVGYALVIVDRQQKIRRWSPDVVRYFGITMVDLGEPLSSVASHLEIPGLHAKLSETIQKGASHSIDVDTERASLSVRIRPFMTAKGSIDGAVIAVLDETAYRQAQRRLAASEERFALAVEGSTEGIWDQSDINASDGYWSPRLRAMLGVAADDQRNSLLALEERVHPEDLGTFRAAMDNHIGKRSPFNVECRLRVNGTPGVAASYRWFHIRGQAQWNAFGQPTRMTGAVADVTQRRLAEIRMHSLYELLQRSEELANVGHWRLDLETHQMMWSDELYRIHGAPVAMQPTLSSLLEFVVPDDRDAVAKLIVDCRTKGGSVRYEARILRDGVERVVSAVAEAERGPSGNIIALFGIMRDITDERQVQDLLRGEAAALGRQVDERAMELEQRVRERELLLKELQHRVKNNLQTIVSLISVQRTSYPDSAEVLEGLAQRIQTIAFVYDLLLQRGDADEADLVVVLRQICAAAQAASPNGTSVALASDVVTCDLPAEQAVKVAMAVQELVSNASKYAFKDRSGRIDVRIGQSAGEWRIVVEDDGVGIEENRPSGGGGLGLRMVRWLLHGMDGRLERVPRAGTRFDIVFPAEAKAAMSAA